MSFGAGMEVTFYGVRGSTPCSWRDAMRYGCNSSCVVLRVPDAPPILLDLGTGARVYGDDFGSAPFIGTALVTHLHWDHVQGLPFFRPVDRPGAEIDVFGPRHPEGQLGTVWEGFMKPPYFPIRPSELRGDIRFHDVDPGTFAIPGARVTAQTVRHPNPTLGYRVEAAGVVVAFIPDHGPGDDPEEFVPAEVLELVDGADLLIHDAQFTVGEQRERSHWGHCSHRYAVEVARQGGVKRLALFHHDPHHDDEQIDSMAHEAHDMATALNIEVFAAAELMRVYLEPDAATPAASSTTTSRGVLSATEPADPAVPAQDEALAAPLAYSATS
ncbi:MAG: MBL fold metallo-hydrolase [Actinobacteria bacterium]|nr:MBL fold metallo-hydrolase [Actinomycetota bacterium]